MDLGSPASAEYQDLYFAALRTMAEFIKSRSDWYRALVYVKTSGANLYSEENRLPNQCNLIVRNGLPVPCICNPAVFAADGFRPSGLYSYYAAQTKLLQELFPDKAMSYALIQDGFPRVNKDGGWEVADGRSSDGSELPGAFELTQGIMDQNQKRWGKNWIVQHNGIGRKPPGCNFDGCHPKPVVALDRYSEVRSGCPNRWAVREGAQGQITGYQTQNLREVNSADDVDRTFQNLWDNTDGVFMELYESVLWKVSNNNGSVLPVTGKTLAAWTEQLHARRTDKTFPSYIAAGNPFPTTFSDRFVKTTKGSDPQTLVYVHGMKCGRGAGEMGQIIINP